MPIRGSSMSDSLVCRFQRLSQIYTLPEETTLLSNIYLNLDAIFLFGLSMVTTRIQGLDRQGHIASVLGTTSITLQCQVLSTRTREVFSVVFRLVLGANRPVVNLTETLQALWPLFVRKRADGRFHQSTSSATSLEVRRENDFRWTECFSSERIRDYFHLTFRLNEYIIHTVSVLMRTAGSREKVLGVRR